MQTLLFPETAQIDVLEENEQVCLWNVLAYYQLTH